MKPYQAWLGEQKTKQKAWMGRGTYFQIRECIKLCGNTLEKLEGMDNLLVNY